MGSTTFTRRSLILATPVASALASRWDEAGFPDWNQKFIDKLLTNSPWAHTWEGTMVQDLSDKKLLSSRWSQLGIGLPRIPGIGGQRDPGFPPTSAPGNSAPVALRVGVDLIVRWASALPVRRALALQGFGRDGMDQEKARAMLSEQPGEYVIELANIPYAFVSSALERQLRAARLSLPGARSMTPTAVELPTMGTHVTAKMIFPRLKNLNSDAGAATFSVESGTLRIREEFKLRSMVYEGRLEL